jgi:hypothetical protein
MMMRSIPWIPADKTAAMTWKTLKDDERMAEIVNILD